MLDPEFLYSEAKKELDRIVRNERRVPAEIHVAELGSLLSVYVFDVVRIWDASCGAETGT
jgi:hypothetical protein